MRRQKSVRTAEETRKAILDAASQLILDHHQKEVDLNELAKLASSKEFPVKRASIYSYFGTSAKREIFKAIVNVFLHQVREGIQWSLVGMSPAATQVERLAVVFRTTLAAFHKNPLYGKVVLQELNIETPDERGGVVEIFKLLDGLIAAARHYKQLDEKMAAQFADWEIRQCLFACAQGLLRSIYLGEAVKFDKSGNALRGDTFTEAVIEYAFFKFLQLFCSAEAKPTFDGLLEDISKKITSERSSGNG